MLAGMDSGQLRGAVLRAWREHAGITSRQLAQRLDVAPATMSSYETGARAHRGLDPYDLAAALGTNSTETDAFVDMWRAAGSITDGMPHTRWAHNYPPPSGPVWVWLRPSPGCTRIRAATWWGDPFQGPLDVEVSDMGILLTAPISIPNPPIEVVFEGKGWADFGTGQIPKEVAAAIGVILRDGRTILGTSAPTSPPLREREQRALSALFGRLAKVANDLGIAWSIMVPHLGMARSDRAPQSLDGLTVGTDSTSGPRAYDDTGLLNTQLLLTGAQTRALREARGLSRGAAAREASALDRHHPISASTIEHLEQAGLTPKVVRLLSRLDTVYAADGRLGVEHTFDSTGQLPARRFPFGYDVRFPRYWIGPVWIQAMSNTPGERGIVDLVWGQWRRKQHVRSGTVLTTRRSSHADDALHVSIPDGWTLTAGVGASPAALDIGHGWWPVNLRAAAVMLRDNIELVRAGAARRGAITSENGENV